METLVYCYNYKYFLYSPCFSSTPLKILSVPSFPIFQFNSTLSIQNPHAFFSVGILNPIINLIIYFFLLVFLFLLLSLLQPPNIPIILLNRPIRRKEPSLADIHQYLPSPSLPIFIISKPLVLYSNIIF